MNESEWTLEVKAAVGVVRQDVTKLEALIANRPQTNKAKRWASEGRLTVNALKDALKWWTL